MPYRSTCHAVTLDFDSHALPPLIQDFRVVFWVHRLCIILCIVTFLSCPTLSKKFIAKYVFQSDSSRIVEMHKGGSNDQP